MLSQEFGRDATPAEIKAYTLAVNNASANSPQTTTTTTTPTSWNPNGSALDTESQTAQTGGIDPTQTIRDQAVADPEHARWQAAGVYFPAILKALGAVA